jgi:hypothetical protein
LINLASAETELDVIDRPTPSSAAGKDSQEETEEEEEEEEEKPSTTTASPVATATIASSSSGSSASLDPETNERESEKADPDDETEEEATEVIAERRPANQMDVMESKTEQEGEESPSAGTADDVKTDLISGTSVDGDVRSNQTDAGNSAKEDERAGADDRSDVGDKMQPTQVDNQPTRSQEPAKSLSAGGSDSDEEETTSGQVEESKTRKDPIGSQSNVISEEILLPPPVLVDPSSAGSQVESSSDEEEEEDERDEANEIRAQVQPEIKSAGGSRSGTGASASSLTSDGDVDEQINDIKLDSFGNAVKAAAGQGDNDSGLSSDEDDDDVEDEDEDETNFLPAIVSDRKEKPAVVEASPGGPQITDTGVAGSGDVEDETNDILPDDPVKTSLMPSLLGGREGENEEEEEDFVDNEIETKIVTSGESSFAGQHDPNRFLHGQTDLNPAVLDTSCGPSTLLPVIPNAVVAKYGRCVIVFLI